ncbi:MAG: hypothetical protein CL847_01920 [Crocinitomicaceae bacterium]|nr:hypothetical protein [Crocinitomicaceae bacterium]
MNKVFAFATLILPLYTFSQDYFQQQVDHVISVQLNDQEHVLDAEITTKYLNNSPDALEEIWMHLWPNAYSSGRTALAKQQYRSGDLFMYYAIAKDLGGIDDIAFKVNGEETQWEFESENPDIAVIHLATPLQPGDSLEIYTPFQVRIPSGKISRLGHIGQSYQITQWYPKPAVYDREGWHAMPYLDQGEFYSEFGTFDVYITLPKNYTVGATGDMPEGDVDNDAESKRLELLDKNTREYFSHIDGINIDTDNSFPKSDEILKTLHFHQENVHDFAWFADKRYKVLRDSVKLPHSGRFVTTWAMFTPNQEKLWEKASDYLNQSTYYYSLWNGDYPYNHVTAVDGTISAGGGMEYPNVTVIGESEGDFWLNVVIAHEVGHNWFYGILGSNERENAWMDEGINSFNETRYLMEYYEGKDLGFLSENVNPKLIETFDLENFEYRWIDELSYLFPARLGVDQPLQCHSDDFSSLNYGAMVYKKTAAVFGFMRQYLGDEKFDKAMKTYFEDWKFKHPTPSDLQDSMEKSTGEDLSWFFEGWIKTDEKNNWKVCEAKEVDGSVEVSLRNIGNQTSPVEVVVYNGDEVVGSTWAEVSSPRKKTKVTIPVSESTHVIIDPNRFDLDYDRKNNYSKTSGILKKFEPIQVKIMTRLDDGNKSQLFWLPTSAWNVHSGAMVGVAVHNTTIPMRNLEWYVNPMMGFKENLSLNGTAAITYSEGKWSAMTRASRFMSIENNENSWEPIFSPKPTHRLSFELNKKFNKVVNSPWSSKLGYEYVRRFGFSDDFGKRVSENPHRESHQLRFEAINSSSKIVGLKQNLGAELRYFNFQQMSGIFISPPQYYDNKNVVAMGNYSLSHRLNEKGDRIKLSLLGAYVFNFDEYSHIRLSSNGFNASNDPMADILLLGRDDSHSFLRAQAPNLYGAVPISYSTDKWFANARVDLDFKKNLDWFIGYVATDLETDLVAGLTYSIGFIKIQMPLYSDEIIINDYNPVDLWTFSLNLMDLHPSKIIRKSL